VVDHAFNPFFTTKEVGHGSGLGLSMVYGFVKQSGGHVTIYSEEGEGTTVKLHLPRSRKTNERASRPDQEDVPEARGETVLVVEDDPEVRTLSVALLRSFGYEILEAADGQTALKILETAPRVNLLFADVVLPGGMSGPELAAEVRDRFPGIAVLCTSGYTELANIDQSAFSEGTELLQKPRRKADLARKVRHALDQAQLQPKVPSGSEQRPLYPWWKAPGVRMSDDRVVWSSLILHRPRPTRKIHVIERMRGRFSFLPEPFIVNKKSLNIPCGGGWNEFAHRTICRRMS
jgi:CheY-like chemotaxis protein